MMVTATNPYLSFSWKRFNLLDQEGVRFDHDDQRYARCLLHAAHQARVVHHLRPLTQSRRHLTAATIGAEQGRRPSERYGKNRKR